MQSEVTINEAHRKYPYLGTYNDYVVLFTKPKCGFFVYIPEKDTLDDTLGGYSEEFSENLFKFFDGVVTLHN